MHPSWWEIKWRIFSTSCLQQPDFSSVCLWGFIPTVFYSCSLIPPKNRHRNKEIILRSYSTALMGLIQLPQGCSAAQTHGKGSPKWHHRLFSVSSDAEKSAKLEQAQKNQTHPLIAFSDCNVPLFPHWCHREIFPRPFGWLQPKYNELSEAGWTQTWRIQTIIKINNPPQQLEWQPVRVRLKKKAPSLPSPGLFCISCTSGGHHGREGREPSSKETFKWVPRFILSFRHHSPLKAMKRAHRTSKASTWAALWTLRDWDGEKKPICGFQGKTKHKNSQQSQGAGADQAQEEKGSVPWASSAPLSSLEMCPAPQGFFHCLGSWNSSGFASLSPSFGFPLSFHCLRGVGDKEEHECRMPVCTVEIWGGSQRPLWVWDKKKLGFSPLKKIN